MDSQNVGNRKHATPEILENCNCKSCFRRDEFPPLSNIKRPSVKAGSDVASFFERSNTALEAATEYYCEISMYDLELGFTRT